MYIQEKVYYCIMYFSKSVLFRGKCTQGMASLASAARSGTGPRGGLGGGFIQSGHFLCRSLHGHVSHYLYHDLPLTSLLPSPLPTSPHPMPPPPHPCTMWWAWRWLHTAWHFCLWLLLWASECGSCCSPQLASLPPYPLSHPVP